MEEKHRAKSREAFPRSGAGGTPLKGISRGAQRLKSCLDTVHGKLLAFDSKGLKT